MHGRGRSCDSPGTMRAPIIFLMQCYYGYFAKNYGSRPGKYFLDAADDSQQLNPFLFFMELFNIM